jgi:hypothetical protein
MPRTAATRRPRYAARASLIVGALGGAALLVSLSSCSAMRQPGVGELIQRQERLELQVQQLEQRLNRGNPGATGAPVGNAPAGRIRSLTYRSGTADDRLRIYWADGSVSDLPCTKEQSTLACG